MILFPEINYLNNEVKLKLFDNEIEFTQLFFEEGLTNGLDITYDSLDFHAEAPLMTRSMKKIEL